MVDYSEPIKHHYIPQFILKNFCFDSSRRYVNFYNVKTDKIVVKPVSEVFMQKNLYRDEVNYSDLPTQVEKDLAKYESDVAKIIKRFLVKDDIRLTVKENDSLLLFFAIMGLRSLNTLTAFKNASDDTKEFYQKFQADGNFEDFWKRNLGFIVKCRSITEIMSHPQIDEPMKIFMQRDTHGILGKYLIVLERRGDEDFLIGDSYPVKITGGKFQLPLFDYYPLTPKRILIIASNGVEGVPCAVRQFNDDVIKKPSKWMDEIQITVKKIYEQVVHEINQDFIKHSHIGLVFKDVNRVDIS